MMTRKHLQAFAEAIKDRDTQLQGAFGETKERRETIIREMMSLVCDVARESNPRFDRARFVKACGWGSPAPSKVSKGD